MPSRKPAAPAEAVATHTADLVGLLVTANRISERLQKLASLSESTVSVADWLLLRSLDGAEPLTKAAVARKIGVSRQRAHQQVNQLQKRGLINPTAGPKGPKQDRTLTLSPEGATAIRKIDEEITAAFSKDAPAQAAALQSARRGAVLVLRSMMDKEAAR